MLLKSADADDPQVRGALCLRPLLQHPISPKSWEIESHVRHLIGPPGPPTVCGGSRIEREPNMMSEADQSAGLTFVVTNVLIV